MPDERIRPNRAAVDTSAQRHYGQRLGSFLRPPVTEFIDEVTSKELRETHWRWLLAFLVLTVASALVGGIVVSGWWSVGTSLAFSLVIFFVSLRAIMKHT